MVQTIIVYIIIATAFLYILKMSIKKFRIGKKDSCSGCDGCSLKKECGSVKQINRRNLAKAHVTPGNF
jgi:hypothetical protein